LHNKPKAEVHLGHKLMGPKEEEDNLLKFKFSLSLWYQTSSKLHRRKLIALQNHMLKAIA
jgi:hypothetical protein